MIQLLFVVFVHLVADYVAEHGTYCGSNEGGLGIMADGLADNTAFLDALRRPGVNAVHSLEATLEDVFVQVTGRSLR